jgi:hypothetical protein
MNKQRSQQIEAKVEEDVREAAPPPARPSSAADLTGTWMMIDGTAMWTVTVENGYLIFREQNTAAPGVVSAVGYGSFDGHTWWLQVQTIVGETGSAWARSAVSIREQAEPRWSFEIFIVVLLVEWRQCHDLHIGIRHARVSYADFWKVSPEFNQSLVSSGERFVVGFDTSPENVGNQLSGDRDAELAGCQRLEGEGNRIHLYSRAS